MSYRGYVAEIPVHGGANFDQNASRVPITDLTDAQGVVIEDGLLRKEAGATTFDTAGIPGSPLADGTFSGSGSGIMPWHAAIATYKGSGFAFVQAMADIQADAPGLALTVPAGGITAGNSIIIAIAVYQDVTITGVSDPGGNTYTQDVIETTGGYGNTAIWSAHNVNALSESDTILISLSGSTSGIAIGCEFSGVSATPLDRTASAAGVGASPNSGNTAPLSEVPELLVGAIYGVLGDPVTVGFTPGSDYTLAARDGMASPVATQLNFEYRVDVVTATIIALHDWRPDLSTQRIISACLDGKIYREWNGNLDYTTLETGLSTTARPGKLVEGGSEGAGRDRKLFYFNGEDAVRVLPGDATNMRTLSQPPIDWSGSNQPRSGIIHRNRLAGFGNLNHPHQLYLSLVGDHEDFQTATGSDVALTYNVYPSVGQRLYGAAQYLGLLWLGKWPHGIFWLDDSDPDTAHWSVQMRTEAIGVAPTPYAMLSIDNDVMILTADAAFHLLSAVQGGIVRDSNLSIALRQSYWLRENINLAKLNQAVSVWYPHKKWALWGVPSASSQTNDLTLLFDFSEVTDSNPLPRFFWSDRDAIDALALRLESDQIERPMLGEAGFVHLLDRVARSKNGEGYTGRYKTAKTDFAHIKTSLLARKKLFDHAVVVKTPTSGTLTLQVEIDGTVTRTISDDLSKRRTLHRLAGEGHEIRLIGENSVVDQDFKIEKHLIFFREGEEGKP